MNRRIFTAVLLSALLLLAPSAAQACSTTHLERSAYTHAKTAIAFTPADCKLAIKVLTQYERLAEKLGVKLSPKRLRELNRKRDNRTITINDLPAKLRRNFPGYFNGMSLRDIARQCFLTYGIGQPWTGWT
jgi:hypothetical protein